MQRARKPLIFLMLGSLALAAAGCGGKAQVQVRRYRPEECPRPAPLCAEDLPAIDGGLPFDAPENVNALMQRHTVLRAHVKEQEAALDCYEAQVGPKGE